jgi:hypothetical protein
MQNVRQHMIEERLAQPHMIRTRSMNCTGCGNTWTVSAESVHCPTCGESPPSYSINGATFCGLHELPMTPAHFSGSFLRANFSGEFQRAWGWFPNASVDAMLDGTPPNHDGMSCPACECAFNVWRSVATRRKH